MKRKDRRKMEARQARLRRREDRREAFRDTFRGRNVADILNTPQALVVAVVAGFVFVLVAAVFGP